MRHRRLASHCLCYKFFSRGKILTRNCSGNDDEREFVQILSAFLSHFIFLSRLSFFTAVWGWLRRKSLTAEGVKLRGGSAYWKMQNSLRHNNRLESWQLSRAFSSFRGGLFYDPSACLSCRIIYVSPTHIFPSRNFPLQRSRSCFCLFAPPLR